MNTFDEINQQLDEDEEHDHFRTGLRQMEFRPKAPVKKAPNSERAYWIDLTARELGKPFNQVMGVTATWRLEWLKEMYAICKQSDNFARLWWGLRKKSLINKQSVK